MSGEDLGPTACSCMLFADWFPHTYMLHSLCQFVGYRKSVANNVVAIKDFQVPNIV